MGLALILFPTGVALRVKSVGIVCTVAKRGEHTFLGSSTKQKGLTKSVEIFDLQQKAISVTAM